MSILFLHKIVLELMDLYNAQEKEEGNGEEGGGRREKEVEGKCCLSLNSVPSVLYCKIIPHIQKGT